MDIQKILAACDHTLLKQESTWEDIKAVLDDAMKYNVASACIAPVWVKKAKEYVGDGLAITTVIGFPNGDSTTAVKVYETIDAINNGADEIDMVIHIGAAKEGRWDEILYEINAIKSVCDGRILKVIIETCLLTDDEKVQMCRVVSESNADYIKTSTGFSTGGATFADVELFAKNLSDTKKIKAAGGISDLEDAQKFLDLGADRLGTSRVVKAVKAQN